MPRRNVGRFAGTPDERELDPTPARRERIPADRQAPGGQTAHALNERFVYASRRAHATESAVGCRLAASKVDKSGRPFNAGLASEPRVSHPRGRLFAWASSNKKVAEGVLDLKAP